MFRLTNVIRNELSSLAETAGTVFLGRYVDMKAFVSVVWNILFLCSYLINKVISSSVVKYKQKLTLWRLTTRIWVVPHR